MWILWKETEEMVLRHWQTKWLDLNDGKQMTFLLPLLVNHHGDRDTSFIEKSNSYEDWEKGSNTPWIFKDIIINLMFLVYICGKWKLYQSAASPVGICIFLRWTEESTFENKLPNPFLFVLI